MTVVQRASLDEVLDFCNKVRRAGGGTPLKALMPGIPEQSEACLIARNLNFECNVGVGYKLAADNKYVYYYQHGPMAWQMVVKDEATMRRIGEALDTEVYEVKTYDEATEDYVQGWAITLPESIGEVARTFDAVYLGEIRDADEVNEFLPYMEAAYREECERAQEGYDDVDEDY